MSILPLYLQYILFFFLYLLHTTENDFLTVSFKTSIDVKRERHLPDKNAICCVRSSKVLPASQATHVQIMDLKNKIQKEKRLKLCCLNCSGSFQQTCSYGSRETRALSPHLTRHRHRAPRFCWQPGLGNEDEEFPCWEPSTSGTLPRVRRTDRCSLPPRSIQAPISHFRKCQWQ